MLKYFTLSWENFTPYSKTNLYLLQIGSQKEQKMKTGIIYSVGLYQRGVVIRGGREREGD